jgi:anti-sigma regulatory factor (Ser/Thr protein kinase)
VLRSAATGKAGYVELPLGPPIGVAGARTTHAVSLERGDALLLFTDGLVEVPGEDIDLGLDRLRELLSEPPSVTDARRLCSLVCEKLGSGSDDIAVLAITLDDGERRTADATFPAESTTPGAARTWVGATLADWEVHGDVVDTAVLGVNELVTNALLHARSTSRVELDLDDQRLLVLVTDTGLGPAPEQQDADPTAMRGRGLLLVEALTDAWGSEQTSRGTTVWFELARGQAEE